jgi:mannose-1-phosphate guanylyltransferase
MQALILAGGEGTRLRPLTSTVPKPVVPLVGRPFIAYMLDWLRVHGVDDVVMSCGHMAADVRRVLGDGSRAGLRLRYVDEPRPLGTGGAVKYAERLLDSRFLMLNGDVLADLDLRAVVEQHRRTGARATLALVSVDDPSAYGLVHTQDDGGVTGFVEKPAPHQIDTHQVSAGAYVLERDVLDGLRAGEPASIEREVFPRLAGAGLYGCLTDGYWLDIGTPERYLEASFDILEGRLGEHPAKAAPRLQLARDVDAAGAQILPSALVGSGSRLAPGARIGPRAVLDGDVTVGPGARIERSVVMRGAWIGGGCELQDCIVAAGARIGERARLSGLTVVGEGAVVAADTVVAGGRIAPGAAVPLAAPAAA